jgi:hypothetical protein
MRKGNLAEPYTCASETVLLALSVLTNRPYSLRRQHRLHRFLLVDSWLRLEHLMRARFRHLLLIHLRQDLPRCPPSRLSP